jgi:hypothetical protein
MAAVSFTGTRHGLTPAQRAALEAVILQECGPAGELHHGDCVGADAEAHALARKHGYRTVIHPPDRDGRRAFCVADRVLSPRPYLERNRGIVDAGGVLLACPGEAEERRRSGTWAAVRYARRTGKHVVLVFPDGTARRENA